MLAGRDLNRAIGAASSAFAAAGTSASLRKNAWRRTAFGTPTKKAYADLDRCLHDPLSSPGARPARARAHDLSLDYGFGAVDVFGAGVVAGVVVVGVAGVGVVVAGVCGAFAFFLRRETPFSRLTSSTCGTSSAFAGSLASCVPIEYACVAKSVMRSSRTRFAPSMPCRNARASSAAARHRIEWSCNCGISWSGWPIACDTLSLAPITLIDASTTVLECVRRRFLMSL